MRLFQNSAIYPSYLPRLRQLTAGLVRFSDQRDAFLADRFGAPHFLLPVLQGSPDAFFTNGDDAALQAAWARERGLKASTPLADILLAQIEEHRTEVFYNMDPLRYPTSFVRRLPASVRKTIAWRAAPTKGVDFTAYDLVVSNFPGILASWAHLGVRTAPFFPAHDPELDAYAARTDRPIDVLFVGGYSRHHGRRALLLRTIAALSDRCQVVMHLDASRLTRLAETPLGLVGPLARHRRPAEIRAVARSPVFGRQVYDALGSAKIVINGAIDMAGEERGNMRCFEALGARALLLSDAGRYPEGMEDGRTLVTYAGADDAVSKISALLEQRQQMEAMADAGYRMVADTYSKARQWSAFQQLAV